MMWGRGPRRSYVPDVVSTLPAYKRATVTLYASGATERLLRMAGWA